MHEAMRRERVNERAKTLCWVSWGGQKHQAPCYGSSPSAVPRREPTEGSPAYPFSQSAKLYNAVRSPPRISTSASVRFPRGSTYDGAGGAGGSGGGGDASYTVCRSLTRFCW